jgi:hypothetical protein
MNHEIAQGGRGREAAKSRFIMVIVKDLHNLDFRSTNQAFFCIILRMRFRA